MKKLTLLLLLTSVAHSQTNPIITQWLRNTTGITGRHYVSGNSTPITDAVAANDSGGIAQPLRNDWVGL